MKTTMLPAPLATAPFAALSTMLAATLPFFLFAALLAITVPVAQAAIPATRPDTIVAADGSGDCKTVQDAINKTPQTASRENPYTILVKPGVYNEIVYIQREKRGVRLIGENAATTIITHNLNAKMPGPDGKPIGTFRTPTLQLDADDFTIENLTIENTAGNVGQALALRVDGDRATFRHCRFNGYQDTILINHGRQYFENCAITGATDFIFGGATAWFENCDIICVAGNYITAASTPKDTAHGYIFSRCRVTAANPGVRTHLGRPWRPYAATIFMHCELAACIRPEGWQKWNVAAPAETVRYAEYKNTGPGATPDKRVAWSRQLTDAEAAALTPRAVLGGADDWRPVE
jgi:pectinesterase